MIKTQKLFNFIRDNIPNCRETETTSYGNPFYGNNEDGVFYSTIGVRFYTETKFSDHYLKTGYVVKGYDNSVQNQRTEGLTVFQDGKFIEITIFDGGFRHEDNEPFRDLFMKLLKEYEIIDNRYVYIASSPIIRHTVVLKRKDLR
jgi:hypothetical protein